MACFFNFTPHSFVRQHESSFSDSVDVEKFENNAKCEFIMYCFEKTFGKMLYNLARS
jgi:hypothetical protein